MMDPQAQIRDIHGLDPAPWFQVAPGWWLLAAAVIVVGTLAFVLVRWAWRVLLRVVRRGAWRAEAERQLIALRRQLHERDPKEVAQELSELMRRIAMARGCRAYCAGLHGEAWLAWLTEHDPTRFKWARKGRVLLELPYAPEGTQTDRRELKRLINAALHWTRAGPIREGKGRRGLRLRRGRPRQRAGEAVAQHV